MLAAAFATVILAPSFLYGVAVDGPRVAYAGTTCRVSIWQAGRTTRLGATPCTERTSTGSGLAGLAFAGGRALWVTYRGGNIRSRRAGRQRRAAVRLDCSGARDRRRRLRRRGRRRDCGRSCHLLRRDLRLVGAGGGRAALVGRDGAHLLELDTGESRSLGPARQARVDGVRVVTANGRRIVVR